MASGWAALGRCVGWGGGGGVRTHESNEVRRRHTRCAPQRAARARRLPVLSGPMSSLLKQWTRPHSTPHKPARCLALAGLLTPTADEPPRDSLALLRRTAGGGLPVLPAGRRRAVAGDVAELAAVVATLATAAAGGALRRTVPGDVTGDAAVIASLRAATANAAAGASRSCRAVAGAVADLATFWARLGAAAAAAAASRAVTG